MGSKLCSKFRKFKKKVFLKKEKYDRLEEADKPEDFPPEISSVTKPLTESSRPTKRSIVKKEKNNQRDDKELIKKEETHEPSTFEDIESSIVNLLEQLKKVSSATRTADKVTEKAEIINNLGAAYYKICDFQMSKKYYEMYLKNLGKNASPFLMQRAHCNIGCVYRRLGDFDQAEEHFQEGLEISEQLQDMKSKGRLLNNMGNICEMRKDFEGAIYYHAQRRKIAETMGDWETEAKACASLGNSYQITGNLRASIVFYERVVIWLKRKYIFEQKEGKRRSIVSSFSLEDEQWV
ncbi:G-protein-signaling modulator 2-like [Actinia tenebrosa]|uniref:G-protein-signaling modulator 2-like n=1 Tax=Actinia tenebrosa TaxID=6105 RepID=A0A6P8HCW9_ACTTE|nr:G-protein-signaling modulator 2-like [Actinia tenebrosa]